MTKEIQLMENVLLKKIDGLETPCFIVDKNDFCNNVDSLKNALNNYFTNNIIAYSMKTNSLPYLLYLAKKSNLFCEVVSYDEYETAKKVGFDISNIVYNGPLKDQKSFIEAVTNGAYVNIETQKEIEWLLDCRRKITGKIGMRLNIDLGVLSPNDAKKGEEASRFGFDYSNGEFQKSLTRLNEAGIKINGIHVHRTSATRSIEVYKNICNYVSNVIKEQGLQLSYIDIGGGFFGNYPGKPEYVDYVSAIKESLPDMGNGTIILEPGNALAASCVKFVTSIIDKKIIKNEIILETDGSRIDIDPFFHKNSYQYCLITESRKKSEKVQKITGCTCLEGDIITELKSEIELEIGDMIEFENQGAYTLTLTPNFIRLLPNVYVLDEDQYRLVRKKESADNWLKNSFIPLESNKPAILFSNAGRRTTLIRDFKKSIGNSLRVIATDNWSVAPALFVADEYYLTPKISDERYLEKLLGICKKENVKVITTCIDNEIELLAKNRNRFIDAGILPLCPDEETAGLCFDKYNMFCYLKEHDIKTVMTFKSLDDFDMAYKNGLVHFPVFIKPRCGSGSVGIAKINTNEELRERIHEGSYDYIIQEYMDCEDFDADVYIDTISNDVISVFSKKKIETRIGGASKTISFKDDKLFDFVKKIVSNFTFCGPVDMDFFYKDGEYYLSEINPRFGGAYLHAFGAGVDFAKMILNNLNGIENTPNIGDYDEDVIMIMYDDVIITSKKQLRGDYND